MMKLIVGAVFAGLVIKSMTRFEKEIAWNFWQWWWWLIDVSIT